MAELQALKEEIAVLKEELATLKEPCTITVYEMFPKRMGPNNCETRVVLGHYTNEMLRAKLRIPDCRVHFRFEAPKIYAPSIIVALTNGIGNRIDNCPPGFTARKRILDRFRPIHDVKHIIVDKDYPN